MEYLDSFKIPFEYSARLVRGLDYYTETVFEVISDDLGAQNSICGGGRYNNLIRNIGGKDIPAVGFAFGLERIVMLLQEQNTPIPGKAPLIFVAPIDPIYKLDAAQIAQELRNNGLSVTVEYDKTDLSYQLKKAAKLKASFCIILGDDEIKNKSVMIKNLSTREQAMVANKDLVSYIKEQEKNNV